MRIVPLIGKDYIWVKDNAATKVRCLGPADIDPLDDATCESPRLLVELFPGKQVIVDVAELEEFPVDVEN